MAGGKIKMKFCESLDRFVEIREFSQEEIDKLFSNIKITDKKSYKRLVINAAIVNYLDEIAPLVFGDNNYSLFGEITEQELYNLCIKVNPALDIKKVTIDVQTEGIDESGSVPLLNVLNEEGEIDISERFINMESYIHKRIVGQDEAVNLVCQAIRRAHVGLRNPQKPIGSFIFAGQTGVGKTELAKALAEFLYGNEQEIIRIDCSEYSQSHEYAKLIGAPPGYIGHKEGGVLTESVKNKPKSVVLFDEIEKAHQKVHNILLQILDDGILTDNHGERITFKDTVIIMTTNVGVEEFKELDKTIGFGSEAIRKDHGVRSRETQKALEKNFPPEFINRIDEIVTFHALSKENCMDIADIMIAEVISRTEKLKISLEIGKDSRNFIVDNGTNLKYGARPLKRAIKTYIENPLAEEILGGKFKPGDAVVSVVTEEKLEYFKKGSPEAKSSGKKKTASKKTAAKKATAAKTKSAKPKKAAKTKKGTKK